MTAATTFATALLAACCALSAHGSVLMEEGAAAVPSQDWHAASPCNGQLVSPIFMLKHSAEALAELENEFWAVSTPGNARYGKHLSQKSVAERFSPSPAAVSTVIQWLLSTGGVSKDAIVVSGTRDMIKVTLSCSAAETLFNTTFTVFEQTRSPSKAVVCRAVTPHYLPNEVAEFVAVVGDVAALPAVRQPIKVAQPQQVVNEVVITQDDAGDWPEDCVHGTGLFKKCGNAIQKFTTIGVLSQRYKLGAAPAKAIGSMGVAEFQGVMWDPKDLRKFESVCGLKNNSITVDHQIGKDAPLTCEIPIIGTELCTEAMLDIEYIKAVGGAIPLTDIYSKGFSLLDWAMQLSKMTSPPLINSVSYGNDEKQQTSTAFMDSVNVQFQKLGVRGISILFAAGDQGVWGRSGRGKRFNPDFPAGSPYVTAVGGTDFATGGTVGDETAWNDGGGGFSDTFRMPAYQASAVAGFKAAGGLPDQSYWNSTGRGYPDVAALGGLKNPYCVMSGDLISGVGGTSASCPVVAATFAKLNEIRLAKNQSALGFLNPFIYQHPAAFNDVTSGTNNGGAKIGFTAVKGWDAATGLGTPNFEALSALV